ncbi:MAG: hypothetical protein AABY65_13105 [Nitrospirota bacterium]
MARMNFMLKVEDAKMTQVKKALEKENIKVVSIYEVYKEKPASGITADPAGTKQTGPVENAG